MTRRSELDAIAVAWIPCPTCHRSAGTDCRTGSDRRARYVHTTRTDAVVAAWRVGYRQGATDTREAVSRYLERTEPERPSLRDSLVAYLRRIFP